MQRGEINEQEEACFGLNGYRRPFLETSNEKSNLGWR